MLLPRDVGLGSSTKAHRPPIIGGDKIKGRSFDTAHLCSSPPLVYGNTHNPITKEDNNEQ